MSDGINNVTVSGNCTRDSELRGSDKPVLKFSIAANESYKDQATGEFKERAEFINCVVFGKRAETLVNLIKKGATVTVQGKLKTSSYEREGQKHYSTDVVADKIVIAGRGGGARDDAPAPTETRPINFGNKPQAQRPGYSPPPDVEEDGDLPF